MLGTSERNAKIPKIGFAKIGQTAVSKPQWVGFSSKKAGCDKFESWEKKFSYPCLGFFHQNHPNILILLNLSNVSKSGISLVGGSKF